MIGGVPGKGLNMSEAVSDSPLCASEHRVRRVPEPERALQDRHRPGPLRWCWYALGGGLPVRYRSWILHDATCATWRLRHFLRAFVQVCVVAAPGVILLPGPSIVRAAALLLGLLVGLQYALWFMDGAVDRRVERAGYPPGAASAERYRVHAEEHAAAAARYAATWRPSRSTAAGPDNMPASRHIPRER